MLYLTKKTSDFCVLMTLNNISMEQMTSRGPLQPIFFYDFIAKIETSLD